MYKFKKLSLGWSEGTSMLSLAIEKLDDGKYSHVYLKFEFEDAPTLIYESHIRGGVQITPYVQLEKAIIDGKVRSVFERELSVSPTAMKKIWEEATSLHGDAYDARQILIYLIWIKYLKGKGKKFVNAFINGKFTCNEFVITACKAALADFAQFDMTFTPERMYRYFYGKSSK